MDSVDASVKIVTFLSTIHVYNWKAHIRFRIYSAYFTAYQAICFVSELNCYFAQLQFSCASFICFYLWTYEINTQYFNSKIFLNRLSEDSMCAFKTL